MSGPLAFCRLACFRPRLLARTHAPARPQLAITALLSPFSDAVCALNQLGDRDDRSTRFGERRLDHSTPPAAPPSPSTCAHGGSDRGGDRDDRPVNVAALDRQS
eukprot:6211340-Pleurochrysis_carterae.AAC.1